MRSREQRKQQRTSWIHTCVSDRGRGATAEGCYRSLTKIYNSALRTARRVGQIKVAAPYLPASRLRSATSHSSAARTAPVLRNHLVRHVLRITQRRVSALLAVRTTRATAPAGAVDKLRARATARIRRDASL